MDKQAQAVVLHVLKKVEAEFPNISRRELGKRVSSLTGVGTTRILKLHKNGVQSPKKHGLKRKSNPGNLDSFDQEIIRRIIYNLCSERKIPTIEMVHNRIKNEADFPYSKATLRRLLLKMNFTFGLYERRAAVLEQPRIRKLRYEYLEKIEKARQQGRKIVYLDETRYDSHDCAKKGWFDASGKCVANIPASRGKRLIILSAGSEDGWVPDALLISGKNIKDCSADYHHDMTGDVFENWMQNQLLPALSEPCTIVMDNASYHSRLKSKIPNSSTKKCEILSFLRDQNVIIPDPVPIKPILLGMVKSCGVEKAHVVDEMALAAGHEVIRLPPYYCIFNPIERAWAQIKKIVREHNISPLDGKSVVNLIREGAEKVTPTNWSNYVRHVVDTEVQYRLVDQQQDQDEDDGRLVINVQVESASSDDDVDNCKL